MDGIHGAGQLDDTSDQLLVIIDTGDERRTQVDGQMRIRAPHSRKVAQDALIAHARRLFVGLAVQMLDVEQKVVELAAGGKDGLFGGLTATFHGGMHGPVFRLFQDGEAKIPLLQRLAAAQGQAAAGAGIKGGIFFHLVQHFAGRHGLAVKGQRLSRTNLRTSTASRIAAFPVPMDAVLLEAQGLLRTGGHTAPAAKAFVRIVRQLRCGLLGFGIAAPQAAQRTALEEDQRPYARAVMHGIALDVENGTAILVRHGISPERRKGAEAPSLRLDWRFTRPARAGYGR